MSFQALCNTLELTFCSTPLKEDELDYASATLVLAGLLQIHTRTPRYASYRDRLESFPERVRPSTSPTNHVTSCSSDDPQMKVRLPSPEELASAGFFHTGSGDETVCPACGLGLRDWQFTDVPETCHLAFTSSEMGLNSTATSLGGFSLPSLPCLYLTARRLLASELPLARKSLVPPGPVRSVCTLPGVISSPIAKNYSDRFADASQGFASLSDRLRAIVRIMSAVPSPEGWPVENARALGHSDDLIVLALWRLQSETTGMSLACPRSSSLRLDPQATTDLLRAILRLQEGLGPVCDEFSDLDRPQNLAPGEELGISGASDGEATAEDVETAALSRRRFQRIRPHVPASLDDDDADDTSVTSPQSVDSNGVPVRRVRLPRLYDFLCWWSNRWPVVCSVSK